MHHWGKFSARTLGLQISFGYTSKKLSKEAVREVQASPGYYENIRGQLSNRLY